MPPTHLCIRNALPRGHVGFCKRLVMQAAHWMLLAGVAAAIGMQAAGSAQDAWRLKRRAAAERPRRLILNNDGCDALYFPRDQEPTLENFLALRTSPLADSRVDTVFYCSISSGFSYFTHRTETGTQLLHDIERRPDTRNVCGPLAAAGTDPLEAVVTWCHRNDRECFWSMRMNDTHDGAHRPDKPYPLFPPFKEAHPEVLIGRHNARPRHGAWTSVDYGEAAIRSLAFRYIEDVCRNYDVDGVELDFFRHLSYFRSTAAGKPATPAEVEAMTALIRRVRGMLDTEGQQRGRPILLAVRVPDCPDYALRLGLDLRTWLREDLLDLVTGGGYFRLKPWEQLVALCRKHNVQICAGLSESRVKGEARDLRRNSRESYRARALAAWQAGVDGIYLFNYFDPDGGILRELDDPDHLLTLGRLHFASVRNGRAARYVPGGDGFRTITVLTPENPLQIPFGDTRTVAVNGTVAWTAGSTVELLLRGTGRGRLTPHIGHTPLAAPEREGPWQCFATPKELDPGPINLRIAAEAPPEPEPGEWTAAWTHTEALPAPWYVLNQGKGTVVEALDNGVRLADVGTDGGDYVYWGYPWNVDPGAETVVEADVRVLSGWNNIIVCNGVAIERICLYPDYIALYRGKTRCDMDTTDRAHTYRIEMKGRDLRVFVDGTLRLDGHGTFKTPAPDGRNTVSFGAANSPSLGEAVWSSVRFRAAGVSATVVDLALRITPPAGEK